jgi:hypothetical protein
MGLMRWLTANGKPIETIATVLQSIAITGAIIAGINEFIWSGKVEERERVRYTIPLLEKASAPELDRVRAGFDHAYYVYMGADMAGRHDSRSADFRSPAALAELERKTAQSMARLAAYYEAMEHCIAASVCSEAASRHALCRDATQVDDDLKFAKSNLERRYRDDKFPMLTPHAQDRDRAYASLSGLSTFADGCRAWNKKHPKAPVSVSSGARKAPL